MVAQREISEKNPSPIKGATPTKPSDGKPHIISITSDVKSWKRTGSANLRRDHVRIVGRYRVRLRANGFPHQEGYDFPHQEG